MAHAEDPSYPRKPKRQRTPYHSENTDRSQHTNNCFAVHPRSQYAGNFPFYRQPKEVGCFSTDSQRCFKHDASQLKYYAPPKDRTSIAFDLRQGYKTRIKKDESIKEFIDNMLKWIQLNKQTFVVQGENKMERSNNLHTDFVSWRGLLTKILCTPYEEKDEWIIAVTLYNGTYYLCEFQTEQKKNEEENMPEDRKEMSYWGFKFEQYVTAATPKSQPDTSVVVNNNESFCSVSRARLNSHSLVFGAEVDCKDADNGAYIELKTSREIMHRGQDRSFKKFKLIKWWAQSFLPGIPKIICGFRDDDGIVRDLQTFWVNEIPRLVKDIPNPWDPCVCFNFCDKFLLHIKHVVKEDDPRKVYVFEYKPRDGIYWREDYDGEFQFLPEWYYKESC